MGKKIYLLKMFILSLAFPLSRPEKIKIQKTLAVSHHNVWQVVAYISPWNCCPQTRPDIHLQPEPLCLFDDEVSNDEKSVVISMLLEDPQPDMFHPGKPDEPKFNPQKLIVRGNEKSYLSAFVNERS